MILYYTFINDINDAHDKNRTVTVRRLIACSTKKTLAVPMKQEVQGSNLIPAIFLGGILSVAPTKALNTTLPKMSSIRVLKA